MTTPKVLITYPLPGDPLSFLQQQKSVDVWMHSERSLLPRNTLLNKISGATAIVVTPGDGPVDEEFIDAVASSKSVAEVMRKINLKPAGSNYATFQQKVKELNLDVSYFTGQGHMKGQNHDCC